MSGATARTVARIAEAAYALVAFGLWLALPFPPRAAFATTWVHWLGTAALAAVIAIRIRRPNRAVHVVAAILAAYVLGTGAFAVIRSGGAMLPGATGTQRFFGLAVIAIVWGSQIAVAVSLAALWRESDER